MQIIINEDDSQAFSRIERSLQALYPDAEIVALSPDAARPQGRKRFLVPCHDGYRIVQIGEVNHISSDAGITYLWLNDHTSVVIDASLSDLEQQLDPDRFFRATRQYIVCIDHVTQLKTWFNYKTRVIMDCYPEVEIIVSKERTSELKKWLNR